MKLNKDLLEKAYPLFSITSAKISGTKSLTLIEEDTLVSYIGNEPVTAIAARYQVSNAAIYDRLRHLMSKARRLIKE